MTSPAKAKCPHCNGTGAWINPHDALDARTCRKCRGRGTLRAQRNPKLHHEPDRATERTPRSEAWPPAKPDDHDGRNDAHDDAYWDKLASEFGEWP